MVTLLYRTLQSRLEYDAIIIRRTYVIGCKQQLCIQNCGQTAADSDTASGGSSPQNLAYNGGLGAEPPAGSRGRAPGQGPGPLKLKHFWLLDVQWKPQICPLFET